MARVTSRSWAPRPGADRAGAPPREARPRLLDRSEERAIAFFATWMIAGLFVDGWAHNVDKPETFFTPWHGILYSGFVAAMVWGAWQNRGNPGQGLGRIVGQGPERLLTIGVFLFVGSAVADMVWHEVFGVEVDVEALLSPSHLMLMVGGLLMATAPVRSAWSDRTETEPRMGSFLPALVALTVSVALVAFFVQYASAFRVEPELFAPGAGEPEQIRGLASIQISSLLLLAPAAYVLRRWLPPAGTFTVLFGGVAGFMSGLQAFSEVALVVPALAAGIVADVLTRRWRPGPASPRAAWLVLGVTAGVLWAGWFATYAAVWELGWTVELWGGSIVFAALGGVGLGLLAFPPPGAREA